MFASTLIDYVCGLVIAGAGSGPARASELPLLEPGGPRTRLQRAALVTSIVSNLSLLGFFKYFNFGIDTYNALVDGAGLRRRAAGRRSSA